MRLSRRDPRHTAAASKNARNATNAALGLGERDGDGRGDGHRVGARGDGQGRRGAAAAGRGHAEPGPGRGRDDLKYAPLPLPIVSPKYFPVRGRVDGVVGVENRAVGRCFVGGGRHCGAVASWAAAAARPCQAPCWRLQVPCLCGYVRKGSWSREIAKILEASMSRVAWPKFACRHTGWEQRHPITIASRQRATSAFL